MRRLSRLPALLGSLASLFVASPALALETSFHTYDGFAETVDAFRLVSMIFADPRYETLVLIVAVVGLALGAVLAMVRGTGMGLVAFGLQMLVGIGLFVGLVATTGTVHVYDRVRNAYQPVGDVPNLIVLVAGVTNMMERALAETIDDNTLDPHAKLEFGAGGHAFDLFLNAVSPRGPMTDEAPGRGHDPAGCAGDHGANGLGAVDRSNSAGPKRILYRCEGGDRRRRRRRG
jgi:conjugal transfer mating pair stabilization protein TraG